MCNTVKRHLTIVGITDLIDDENDDIAQVIAKAANPAVELRRVRSVMELLDVVADHRARHGVIDVLDIVDHGRAGLQRIGKEVLFSSDHDPCHRLTGEVAARALGGHMSEVGQLRLLGCRTATDEDGITATLPEGRLLVYKVAKALGKRRVCLGTVRATSHGDFQDLGMLLPDLEDEILYSSHGVVDGNALAHTDRLISHGILLGQRC